MRPPFSARLRHQEEYRGWDIHVTFTGRFIKAVAIPNGRTPGRVDSGPMSSDDEAIAWAQKFIDDHINRKNQLEVIT